MACSSLIAAAIDCFDDGSAIIVCPFECPNGSRRDMQGQRLDRAATRTLDMIDCVEMAAAPDGAPPERNRATLLRSEEIKQLTASN